MRVSVGSLLGAGALACVLVVVGCQSDEPKAAEIPLTTVQCMNLGGSVGQDKSCPHTTTKMFNGNLQGQFRCGFSGRAGICIDNGR